MSKLSIQKLRHNDIKQQAAIHSLSFRKAYQGIIPDNFLEKYTIEKSEKAFISRYEESVDTYTIKNDSDLIGFSTFGHCRDEDKSLNTGEIQCIYIHPSFWHKGFGSVLFDFTVSELFYRKYNEITLWVLELNLTARQFYEHKGFQSDGSKKEIKLGIDLTEIRYRLNK